MSSPFDWAEALKIDERQIRDWMAEKPKDQDLLLWCLRSRRVDEQAYLQWASEIFGLPVLRPEFFSVLPTGEEKLRELIKGDLLWRSSFFPVHLWDEVMFIACVHPEGPPDISPLVGQIVLAPPSELDQLWSRIHSETVTRSAGSLPTLGALNTNAEMSEAQIQEESFTDERPRIPTARPAGATLTLEEMLAKQNENPPNAAPEELASEPTESAEAPLGLNLAHTHTSSMPVSLSIEPEAEPESVPEAEPELELEPEPEAAAHTSEESRAQFALSQPPPPPPRLTMALKPQAPAPSFDSKHLAQQALQQLSQWFEKTMILVIDKTCLRPVLWSENWSFTAGSIKKPEISLAGASAFKIVFETQMPFHGPISLNETNQNFFNACNAGVVPEQLTLVPVSLNQELAGVLLAAGPASCYTPEHLEQAERISASFSSEFLRHYPQQDLRNFMASA